MTLKMQNIKNPEVYWIHRIILFLYILGLVFLGIGMLSKFDLNALMAFAVLVILLGWMIYLHYIAASESVQGTARARNISRLIALIFLLLFPIGTLLAIYLFYKTSETEWQK